MKEQSRLDTWRFGNAPNKITVTLAGTSFGRNVTYAADGAELSYTVSSGTPSSQQWQVSADGVTGWTAAGTGATETIGLGSTHTDDEFIRVAVIVDSTQYVSNAIRMRYQPITAANSLADPTYVIDTGVKTIDAAADFTIPSGINLTWAVTSLTGVTIDGSGEISVDTDTSGTLDTSTVVVRPTDQYGWDQVVSAFSLTILASLVYPALTAIAIEGGVQNATGDVTFVLSFDSSGTDIPVSIIGVALDPAVYPPTSAQVTAGLDLSGGV